MPNSDLEEKLNCVFADVGTQIGDLVRLLVENEIKAHMQRIEDLKKVISPVVPPVV
jgi:hypothetical protein